MTAREQLVTDKLETFWFALASMFGGYFVDPVIAPSIVGALLAVYQRWRRGRLMPIDFIWGAVAGIAAGKFLGAPVGSWIGLKPAGAFIFALGGANIVEAAIDYDGKRAVEWFWNLFGRPKDPK